MSQPPHQLGTPTWEDPGFRFTFGNWSTEADSAAALDDALDVDKLWKIYREVPGVLVQPRPAQEGRPVRIDRVLIANPRLVGLGWRHGAIGVEIKKSGVKIGGPIAQAMDYSRAVWTLPTAGGIRVWLDWIFIWPMPKQSGPLASVLAQNRIGSASADRWTRLYFKSGEANIIKINNDGPPELGAASNGRSVGSR